MRKCVVKKWKQVDGKSLLVDDYVGTFHGWGVNYEEFETGPGNFSAAIIENASGSVELVYAGHVKFLEPETNG